MPRCADETCGRWRPDLAPLGRLGTARSARALGALQFNGKWYCSRACVEHAAAARLAESVSASRPAAVLPPLRLGVLLRHDGTITQDQLDAALARAKKTGLRLGAQLEQLGFATADDVLRALAAQSGVSYLTSFDLTRIEKGPAAVLPAAMARALGMVPFEADEVLQRLSVICAAPVSRAAARALSRLTSWTPEIYLVADRVFEAALGAYRPSMPLRFESRSSNGRAVAPTVVLEAVTVGGLAAAAAHVADLAVNEGAVTMRHAECNDYRLVRVQGPQRVRDLLVTREEAECQAELTAH